MAEFVAPSNFQFILRIRNTNVDGRRKTMFAITAITGIGRRLANLLCKKADIDLNKRAGLLTPEEIEKLMAILANPLQFKVPEWFLNRRRDLKDGKTSQITSNDLLSKLRDDIEGLKKIRAHRGLRHFWGLKVRGQHTKSSGRGRVPMGPGMKKH